MNGLQKNLYDEMRGMQKDDGSKHGLSDKTVQTFIDDNPKFKQMMNDGHMAVRYIDADGGKTAAPHAVLSIGDGKGGTTALCDPQARDEGQVVTDKAELADYEKARLHKREQITPSLGYWGEGKAPESK
jgi:hypothetical protein